MSPLFTAALFAGGKSTRMGRDKAYLSVEWGRASIPLWERQVRILQSIMPEELVISGPRKPGYPASVTVWEDDWKGVGPLGGIATCLKKNRSTLLLVLAVDLPRIQTGFLQKLLSLSEAGCGIIPVHRNRFEPLIAVYPLSALAIAIDQLQEQDYALQHFVARLLENRLMVRYEIEPAEEGQLENWNRPEDAL
jgi:molybdenum cofactor guanylyltransferase